MKSHSIFTVVLVFFLLVFSLFAACDQPTDNSPVPSSNLVPGKNLSAKIQWLDTNVESDSSYTIEVTSNESIDPITLFYSGKDNVTVTIKGVKASRTISLNTNGSMFIVGSGVTLILDNNLELKGRSDNSGSLISVYSGANLILNSGARVTNNTRYNNRSSYGGGVYVSSGTFTMKGGKISGNSSDSSGSLASLFSYGGGVYVYGGTFIMSGGEISGNPCFASGSILSSGNGGGVYVSIGGTFTMSGGGISSNTADNGGGVYVSSGTFVSVKLSSKNVPGKEIFPVSGGFGKRCFFKYGHQILKRNEAVLLGCLNEGEHATGTFGAYWALIE